MPATIDKAVSFVVASFLFQGRTPTTASDPDLNPAGHSSRQTSTLMEGQGPLPTAAFPPSLRGRRPVFELPKITFGNPLFALMIFVFDPRYRLHYAHP